jgi:O-acetyl-ADP-ribose deacetylase (regulator of RNase III)
MKIEIIQGDITKLALDAIVNAANETLIGGGGVDGAIHGAAGPGLLAECKELRKTKYPDGLPMGQAAITQGYNLPSKHVIHTFGPIYDEVKDPARLLADSYRNCLQVAEEHGLKSIAFPAISTGIFGYPKEEAAQVVKKVLAEYRFTVLEKVVLCYFSKEDKDIAERVFNG